MKSSAFLLSAAAILSLSIVSPVRSQIPDRFDQWDKDKDGKLTKEELPAPIQRNFDRLDQDGDGFVSRAEDTAFRERMAQNRNPGQRPGGNPNQGGAALEGIKKLENQDYAGTGNPRQMLDLYLPESPAAEGPLPVVAFIHGGGWQNGSKDGAGRQVVPFVATGKYAGVSIGYRLTDEAHMPSQIHDCKAAIRWLKANAEKYNLDPERIAVWGSSAGGHLVAMLGTTGDVPDLEGDIGPNTAQNSKVACVVDYYGPTELLTMDEGPGGALSHMAPDSPESKLAGGPILENQEAAKAASPITYVSAEDGPYLIVHGDEDPVVVYSQSVKFEKALEAAGVETFLVTVKGGGHGKGFGPDVKEIVTKYLNWKLLGEEPETPMTDQTVSAVRPQR